MFQVFRVSVDRGACPNPVYGSENMTAVTGASPTWVKNLSPRRRFAALLYLGGCNSLVFSVLLPQRRRVTSLSAIRFGPLGLLRGGATPRAMTTLVDEGVASISNFAVGIVVARLSGPAGLGAFALAYAIWILVTLIHRSMIVDPMVITGDLRGDQKDEFIQRGFAADVTLGVMAACIIAAVGTTLLVVGQHTLRSRPAFAGSLDSRARSAGLLATDRFLPGNSEEDADERPRVQRRAGTGVRGDLLGGSALGLRGCLGLGLGSGGCGSLRSSAILCPRLATGGMDDSLVPLANESVVGWRAYGLLGEQPALSDPCRRAVGPGCPRRLESGAATDGRGDKRDHQGGRSYWFSRG